LKHINYYPSKKTTRVALPVSGSIRDQFGTNPILATGSRPVSANLVGLMFSTRAYRLVIAAACMHRHAAGARLEEGLAAPCTAI
jgi:hypothetical protein